MFNQEGPVCKNKKERDFPTLEQQVHNQTLMSNLRIYKFDCSNQIRNSLSQICRNLCII